MSSLEAGSSSSTSSNSICPSKSTVYFGNISYSITNNDLVKIVEHCGKVVCAKITKDKVTRKSKGYGFVQFLKPEDAAKCVEEFNGSQMFGRKWNCSIAIDNGRSTEFIRKREYPDKTRCYECGDYGHLSYKCSKNSLGDREPPPKKKRKRKHKMSGASTSVTGDSNNESTASDEESEADEQVEVDSLNAAINYQRQMADEQEYREAVATGNYGHLHTPTAGVEKKRFVKDKYFSDEEEIVESDG